MLGVALRFLEALLLGRDLVGPGEHRGVQRLDGGKLGFQCAHGLRLLLVAADRRFELRCEGEDFADLRGGAIHGILLLLEAGGLLHHLLGHRLEDAELVLGVRDAAGNTEQRVQRLFGGGGTALDAFHLGGRGLRALLDAFQTRGRVLLGVERIIVHGAQAPDVLAQIAELRPQAFGVAVEGRELGLEGQEAIQVVAHPVRFVNPAKQLGARVAAAGQLGVGGLDLRGRLLLGGGQFARVFLDRNKLRGNPFDGRE